MRMKLIVELIDAHYNREDSELKFIEAARRIVQHFESTGHKYTAEVIKSHIDLGTERQITE